MIRADLVRKRDPVIRFVMKLTTPPWLTMLDEDGSTQVGELDEQRTTKGPLPAKDNDSVWRISPGIYSTGLLVGPSLKIC